jgi:N utilization substance protein A
MTPEQLEEVPGIGEKTVEKISVAVRHYFGQYEEGEERPAAAVVPEVSAVSDELAEVTSLEKTPEELLAAEAGTGEAEEVKGISSEDISDAEDAASASDAYSDADAREEQIELDNDAVDSLVDESQEVSDEGIDGNGNDRG